VGAKKVWVHAINDLIWFVSSLDSTMFGIGNVVCGDLKQCVSRSSRLDQGFYISSSIFGNFLDYEFMFFGWTLP